MPAQQVTIRDEVIVLPTYMPDLPDRNPMFLETRVYQGSSGKVYPLPFTDRIATTAVPRKWKALWLENQYLRVLILPEIGGRIHAIQDKSTGYDLIYRQDVIKPALVGLAGPWASGGIEFNWPQHHRPATFLPVDTHVERAPDGSITIWCSDHDPMARLKGMHGVCLRPDRAAVELRVRAFNRTPHVQSFLWWANLATRAHEAYQSFFPPDVVSVADHARRSTSHYPRCEGSYYGVNYGERAKTGVPEAERPRQYRPPASGGTGAINYPANDLSFYANIPVPTSYMAVGTKEDFVGGYDHAAKVGLIHIANHHISPGKKQWTWGNHEFGYAWDRNLTDPGAAAGSAPQEYAPYIEIMAGVYTDNQPDFSFLAPGETKTWTQHWYPIHQIGPVHKANIDAALNLHLTRKQIRIGICVSRPIPRATIELIQNQHTKKWNADLAPAKPLLIDQPQPSTRPFKTGNVKLRVLDAQQRVIIEYEPKPQARVTIPPPATEPPNPSDVPSTDELFIIGLHLEQYRHATRSPLLYWQEALRRDPLDSRCNCGIGRWHMLRGEFELAEKHFRSAIARQTSRNANPNDGEALFNLGLTLRYQLDALSSASDPTAPSKYDESYAVFYKATWNAAWAAPAYHAIAEMDCRREDWQSALAHLNQSLRFDTDNLRARDLKAFVLRRLSQTTDAESLLTQTLQLDPLDWWARHLTGQPIDCDLQTALDIVHDLARAGLYAEAINLLQSRLQQPAQDQNDQPPLPRQDWGALPLALYTLAWLQARTGDTRAAQRSLRAAAKASPDYCFPARLEEIAILRWALHSNSNDARAAYYLGNLYYDRKRYDQAIPLWQKSAKLEPSFSIPWRNLGIACFNVHGDKRKSRQAYDRAIAAAPHDARLLFERDQLWKRINVAPKKRLAELLKHSRLVQQRDDLTIELCALLNQTGQHQAALELLKARQFQPWEGGEGQALGQWVRTNIALGKAALSAGNAQLAAENFTAALTPPQNLSEARHLLANQSDVHFWCGEALQAAGRPDEANAHWTTAAEFKGDFQQMSVRPFSEMTYFTAMSLRRLGRKREATALLRQLLKHAQALATAKANIDYFATSLPTMLLFNDDLQHRQQITALFLQAQAHLGLGDRQKCRRLLQQVLRQDQNHPMAGDLHAELRGR